MHKILSSNDYKKFKLMPGNRPVGKRVNRLIRAIKRKNFLAQFPIVCQKNGDGRLFIADGQHRFEAAKALKLPVFYVETKNMTIADVSGLNSEQRAWNATDYMNSNIGQGKKDYIILKDFMETYTLPISAAIEILDGTRGGNTMQRFREGRFVARNITHGRKVGASIAQLRPFVPFCSERSFVNAVSKLVRLEAFDIERLTAKMEYQRTKMVKCVDADAYVELIEEIYNFKVRPRQLVPLALEVKRGAKQQ
ncbi:MAG: hypothetical protein QOI07_895 [Verrucomicrobiota bacterium]|jgi:hypothetical protein